MADTLGIDVVKHTEYSRSSAQKIGSNLEKQGIAPGAVSGKHLESVYATLRKSRFTSCGQELNLPVLSPCETPENDDVWGVIVESRKHPALEYVVTRFANLLGIRIQLFHGSSNKSFIKDTKIGSLVAAGDVVLSQLYLETLSPVEYNALLLSKDFWYSICGRKKILVFQTDAMVCSNSDYQLNEFMGFDYIGSAWNRERPVGLVIDGGNGGLSLRDWRASIACLERFHPALWPGGEDGYFAFHLELVGGRVAKQSDCAKFSTQDKFLAKSLGAHKISELEDKEIERFIQYCPDIRVLIEGAGKKDKGVRCQ
jgi:hypothetical protein